MPRIQPAQPSEYPEIVSVWEASVRATHHFLSEADIGFFRPLILNEYLAAVTLRCLKDATGRILGFVGVADGSVEMLFLAPDAMGLGHGRRLLQHAIAELGAERVDVNEQNPNAVAFYRHCGFTVTGRSAVDGMGKPFPLLHLALLQDETAHQVSTADQAG